MSYSPSTFYRSLIILNNTISLIYLILQFLITKSILQIMPLSDHRWRRGGPLECTNWHWLRLIDRIRGLHPRCHFIPRSSPYQEVGLDVSRCNLPRVCWILSNGWVFRGLFTRMELRGWWCDRLSCSLSLFFLIFLSTCRLCLLNFSTISPPPHSPHANIFQSDSTLLSAH